MKVRSIANLGSDSNPPHRFGVSVLTITSSRINDATMLPVQEMSCLTGQRRLLSTDATVECWLPLLW